MADVLRDLSKWLNLTNLQPENMTALLVALGQGSFIAEDVIPRIPSTDEFLWLTEDSNDQFTLARKRGERGEASKNELFDSKLSGETYEYFESSDITAKTLRKGSIYSFVNLTVRKTSMIAGKIKMNIERDLINAMTDTTTYSTINTRSGSALWTSTSTSDPIKDVALAKNDIVLAERISEPDTLILGSTDKTYMTISDNIRDTIQYTRDYTQTGMMMEFLMGLRLLTSTAIYISGTTDVRLLSGTGIVLKRGYSGELRESEPYMAYTDYDKRTKVLTIFGSRIIKPIITRPKSICLINNVS
jgi:hypothetical protein